MMNPPDEFFDEYWKMRERMNWAKAGLGRGQDVAQAKLLVADCREFYAKWHPVIHVPELRAGLEAMNEHVEKNLGAHLEQLFRSHLHEVIEARKDWWTSEMLLKMSVNFINLIKHSPAELRPGLEKIHRDYMKKDFVPETYYRDAEADAAGEEAKFRKALAGLEVDWPERVDAALRGRLEQLDGPGGTAWQTELEVQSAAWGEKRAKKAPNA